MKKLFIGSLVIFMYFLPPITPVSAEDGALIIPVVNDQISKTLEIRNITTTSVEVAWEGSAIDAIVMYREAKDSFSLSSENPCPSSLPSTRHHCVHIAGLNPGTLYFYKIPTHGEFNEIQYLVGGSFKTAVVNGEKDEEVWHPTTEVGVPNGTITVTSENHYNPGLLQNLWNRFLRFWGSLF